MLRLFVKNNNAAKRGFTLVELLVVIAIIGLLSSVVLVSMQGARRSARDSRRKADMRQIITAQEMYYGTNDVYYTNAGTTWPTAIGTYMPKTPTDPGSGTYVWINNTGDAQKFCAYATIEAGGYYTASNAGNFACAQLPTLADCCF